jgi:hypothetical protein
MENTIAFGIKGIEIVNSIIQAPPEGGIVSNFNFELQFRTIANPKEGILSVFSDAVVKDLDRNLLIGQYSVLFHYSVTGLEKVLKLTEGNQSEIPQPLVTTLLGISASTLRGLMFGAFKGTFLQGAILPVVDIMALQPELMPTPN